MVTYIQGNGTLVACTGVGAPLPEVQFDGIICTSSAVQAECQLIYILILLTLFHWL